MTMHPTEAQLLAHLDDELHGAERADVAQHVRACVACADKMARLQSSVSLLAGVLYRVDEVEPAGWRTKSDAVAGVTRARNPGQWRWAAAILLVLGAAASAAVLNVGGLFRATTSSETTLFVPTTSAPPAAGGVAVRTVDGAVDITFTNVARGTRLLVVMESRADARVSLSGDATPHFIARAGHVGADLGNARADVTITVPAALRQGTVRVAGTTVIRIVEGRITPAHAATTGVIINPQQDD